MRRLGSGSGDPAGGGLRNWVMTVLALHPGPTLSAPAPLRRRLVVPPRDGLNAAMQEAGRDAAILGALVRRIAVDRDKAAFAELFRAIGPKVKGFLMRRGTDAGDAEELVQEVMLLVWRRAERFDPARASVTTWVFTIARNQRIDRLRRERRPELDPDDPAFQPDPVDGADAAFEAAEDGARLRQALVALPPEQADLLKMAYFEDKSHRAIADETRLPLGTVKSRIRLALARLRDSLGRP